MVTIGQIQGPADANPGDSIWLATNVTNDGESAETVTVYAANSTTDSSSETDVQLSPGEEQRVYFGDAVAVKEGINDITVGVRGGPKNTAEFPVESEGAQTSTDFSIVGGDNPREITPDSGRSVGGFSRDVFPVSVDVKNNGGAQGSVVVELSGKGESQQLSKRFDAGEVRTFDMLAAVPDPGEDQLYRVTLLSGGDEVGSDTFYTRMVEQDEPILSITEVNHPEQLPADGSPIVESESDAPPVFPVEVGVDNAGSVGTATVKVISEDYGTPDGGVKTREIQSGDEVMFDLFAFAPDPFTTASYEVWFDQRAQQTFTVSREGSPASVVVESVSAPDEVDVDTETFIATVSLKNTGDKTATGEVVVADRGRDVSIGGGETVDIEVEIGAPTTGESVKYTVETPTDNTDTFTVSGPPEPANFQIVDIATPDVIDPEEYPAAFDV